MKRKLIIMGPKTGKHATVRQTGDRTYHVAFKDGEVTRSTQAESNYKVALSRARNWAGGG